MSKIIYIYSRVPRARISTEIRLLHICNRLTPDNIMETVTHTIRTGNGIAYAVISSNLSNQHHDMSVMLGHLYESEIEWYSPYSSIPDGSYAIFRNNDDYLEILSDPAATRTIWYYLDNEQFVASTSQSAIILYLGNFIFDERVIPWVLSTGTLGNDLSWDKRLSRLQPASSLLLEKNTMKMSINSNSVSFLAIRRSKEEYLELLHDAIADTIKTLRALDFSRWLIPLSGGYDSRAIICFLEKYLENPRILRTVTWGLKKSLKEERNDAKIAKELSSEMNIDHVYYSTDSDSYDNAALIMHRFIQCTEGRIDHISGYMDGMEIWRKIHDAGNYGIIRGDEGFGWKSVQSEQSVRMSVGCPLCKDFINLKTVIRDYGLPEQKLHSDLIRQKNESLDCWRDRLYHMFRLPTILAALSDIKLSYIEQLNPLLSRTILNVVREMPDNLRTDKYLFKSIVDSVSPNIPYARKAAIASNRKLLKMSSITRLLKNEISSTYSNQLFGSEFVKYIMSGIEEVDSMPHSRVKSFFKSTVMNRIHTSFYRLLKHYPFGKPRVLRIDGNVLAFRVYIILRMKKLLDSCYNI